LASGRADAGVDRIHRLIRLTERLSGKTDPAVGAVVNASVRHRDPLKKVARIRKRLPDENGRAVYLVDFPDGERGTFMAPESGLRRLTPGAVHRYLGLLDRYRGSRVLPDDGPDLERVKARVRQWVEKAPTEKR